MPRFWTGFSSIRLTWAKQPSPSSANWAGEPTVSTVKISYTDKAAAWIQDELDVSPQWLSHEIELGHVNMHVRIPAWSMNYGTYLQINTLNHNAFYRLWMQISWNVESHESFRCECLTGVLMCFFFVFICRPRPGQRLGNTKNGIKDVRHHR